MTHQQHVALIKKAIPKSPGIWADFGSGEGAFTLAVADLLPFGSKMYSIDRNSSSLKAQEAEFKRIFPTFTISFHTGDFIDFSTLTPPLSLKGRGRSSFDGIIMANSLHFVEDKISLLKELKKYLKPGGRIVFVEYNVDQGNQWVPYPFSFESLKQIANEAGLSEPVLAGKVSSQFLNEMYCAYMIRS